MYRKIAMVSTMLMIGVVALDGCKKEASQKTESQPSVPAPTAVQTPTKQPETGEALFKQHCAVCHPDGGNVVKPEYSLHSKALKARNINRPEDIVRIMRNPGQGMNRFDEATIPDKDAMAIAEYILRTYTEK